MLHICELWWGVIWRSAKLPELVLVLMQVLISVHTCTNANASVAHMATGSVGGKCIPLLVLFLVLVLGALVQVHTPACALGTCTSSSTSASASTCVNSSDT